MRELEGKNAIITGANRGLGKSLAKRFAENGCNIWACARKSTAEFEEYIATLAEKNGVIIKPVYFDLCDKDSIKSAYREISAEKRSIDILVNNAGIGHMGLFQMTKFETVEEIYNVNLFAPMYLSQLVLRNMSRQKSGDIINIVSTAASEVYEGNAVYGSSKAALAAFTKSLAAETGGYGVRVNAVAPGLIDTDMSAVFEGKDPEEPIRHTALGRKIYPDEVSDVVISLLSDKMKIFNGEVICVNGGHK